MNVRHLVQIPWQAAYPSLRWMAVTVFVLCSLGAIAIGMFAEGPKAIQGAVAIYGSGLAYVWGFFLSLGLLLAMDARQLRLPGLQRRIHASLLLYGVAGIAAPLLVPGVGWKMAAVLALFSSGGLAFALMPRYLAVILAMTPALATGLWRSANLPGIGDPRFAPWASLAALILLLASAWRWRQLVRAGHRTGAGWSAPIVLQFRNGSWGYWNCVGDRGQLRNKPDWLQTGVDLTGAGPGQPRKALRVALGGWYLPQTLGSYGKQLALILGVLLVPFVSLGLLSMLKSSGGEFAGALEGSLLGMLSGLMVMAAPMICLFSVLWLGKRWRQVNAELPLLALLPGLGDPLRLKWRLLRTALGLPLALHGLLVLLLGVVMLFWRDHAYVLSWMLLAQVGGAVVTAAMVINLLGGHALSPWRIGLILIVIGALTIASVLLPAIAMGRHPEPQAIPLLPILPFCWALVVAFMAWLCLRGWRQMMQQPHPFLVD